MTYQGPDGEFIPDPSLEEIRPLLDAGPDYWDGGSGSAAIGWLDRLEAGNYALPWELNCRPSLQLFARGPDLVHLAYVCVRDKVELMVFNGAAPEGEIEQYIGGEPAYYPRRSFVGRAEAERAIGHFLETHAPSPAITWKPRRNLGEGRYGYGGSG